MTLEKNKEDQSKYYLYGPKSPVLKWANCDTVEDWASIPKFSTLNDIVTLLRLLELFFDDEVLVYMIFHYTKLYSHKQKPDIIFEVTDEKNWLFLSMLLLSKYHKLPDHKMYGRRYSILLCRQGLIQCLVICSSVFLGIFIFATINIVINKTNFRSSFL